MLIKSSIKALIVDAAALGIFVYGAVSNIAQMVIEKYQYAQYLAEYKDAITKYEEIGLNISGTHPNLVLNAVLAIALTLCALFAYNRILELYRAIHKVTDCMEAVLDEYKDEDEQDARPAESEAQPEKT